MIEFENRVQEGAKIDDEQASFLLREQAFLGKKILKIVFGQSLDRLGAIDRVLLFFCFGLDRTLHGFVYLLFLRFDIRDEFVIR